MEYLIRNAPTALPSGLRNATETVGHLMAQRMPPSPMKDELVGMTENVMKSFHDLLVGESESSSNSDSSRGSHHRSHECFMAGTPKGHIKSIHKEEATLMNNPNDEAEGETAALPCMQVE